MQPIDYNRQQPIEQQRIQPIENNEQNALTYNNYKPNIENKQTNNEQYIPQQMQIDNNRAKAISYENRIPAIENMQIDDDIRSFPQGFNGTPAINHNQTTSNQSMQTNLPIQQQAIPYTEHPVHFISYLNHCEMKSMESSSVR